MSTDRATVTTALAGIKSGMDTVRSVLDLIKGVKDILPDGTRKTIIESLEKADREIKLGEIQIAQMLGYRLCHCTFPPQIMLGVGTNVRGQERFQCPRCKKLEPSDQPAAKTDTVIRYNAGPPREGR
ncbi:MAG TPA: hypothetical protein VEU53_02385 [Stellaceae bacterium]|nr:hypothetical protein [Stellaceae bacterium]